jgi:tetratricopeptide (TPR) repeat protein
MASGEFEDAIDSYSKAMNKESMAPLATKLASALRRGGRDWSAVRRPLEEWLASHPKDVMVRTRLGMEATAAGRSDVAIGAYRRVLESQPNNVLVLNDLAWLLYSDKASDEAVEMARKAYQLKPDAGAIQDTYGWILIHEGQVDQGLKLIEKAHRAIPQHPEIAYHYAYALKESGNKAKAKEVLGQLLKSHEKFPSRADAEKLMATL